MVDKTPYGRYKRQKRWLKKLLDRGDLSQESYDLIIEFCDAYDENCIKVPCPEGESNLKYETLRQKIYHLGRVAQRIELADANKDDINEVMQALFDGTTPVVKDSGLSKSSVRTYQMSTRTFYKYHKEIGPDSSDISTFDQQGTKVDPDDMLTKEEIRELRDACDHPRDKAIIDLLLYTGQRNTAIRTLKVGDVDVKEGWFKLNGEDGGTKGAEEVGGRRPLLHAEPSVRNWLEYHPDPDEDHYLITAKPEWNEVDPTEPIQANSLARAVRKVADKAGIEEKPTHPHALRHNFVTIAKRDYEMDNSTIKYLIGHKPESKVMETTYQHLSDKDYMDAARESIGKKEPEEHSPLTPDVCGNCGDSVPENAKACPSCGTRFTPDAEAAQNTIDDLALDGMREAEHEKEADAVEQFRDYIKNNPEEAVKILEEQL
jgi:integrase